MKKDLSMVFPVYNMEPYLKKCIDTVLLQTYKDFEVILVDDGSTDNSGALCDAFANDYPEFIRVIHKENGGLSSARNAGIGVANGEFIVFPDPDDWLESDYVECFFEIQKEHLPDLACVGHYTEFDDKTVFANKGASFVTMNRTEAMYSLFVEPSISGFAWNKLYRIDIIKENHLLFLDDVGTKEDMDFTYRYLKFCNKICFAPNKRVYHYYQRSGAATHSDFSSNKLDSFNVYEKILNDTDDDYLKYLVKLDICSSAINLMWIYKNSSVNDKEAYCSIKRYLSDYLLDYLRSSDIPFERKIQALAARVSPSLFCFIKNIVTRA